MERPYSRVLAVAVLFVAGALSVSIGCSGSRFPGCKTNAECTSDEPPKPGEKKHSVCFDFRCVECHYDDDCPDGSVCNKLNECASLNSTKPDQTPAGSASSSQASRPPRAF